MSVLRGRNAVIGRRCFDLCMELVRVGAEGIYNLVLWKRNDHARLGDFLYGADALGGHRESTAHDVKKLQDDEVCPVDNWRRIYCENQVAHLSPLGGPARFRCVGAPSFGVCERVSVLNGFLIEIYIEKQGKFISPVTPALPTLFLSSSA